MLILDNLCMYVACTLQALSCGECLVLLWIRHICSLHFRSASCPALVPYVEYDHPSSLLSPLSPLLSTLYSLLSTLYSLLSTLYSLLSPLYSLLSTLYSLLSTLFSLLSSLLYSLLFSLLSTPLHTTNEMLATYWLHNNHLHYGQVGRQTTGMQNEEKKKIYNKLFKRGIHVWYRVEVDWKNKLYWQLYSPKVRKMRGLSFGYLHISLPSPLPSPSPPLLILLIFFY